MKQSVADRHRFLPTATLFTFMLDRRHGRWSSTCAWRSPSSAAVPERREKGEKICRCRGDQPVGTLIVPVSGQVDEPVEVTKGAGDDSGQ